MHRAKGVLDQDAGSALRVFRHLAFDPHTNVLALALVTGRLLLVDAVHGPDIVAALQALLEDEWTSGDVPRRADGVRPRIAGRGGRAPIDWDSRTYVRLMTRLFEQEVLN